MATRPVSCSLLLLSADHDLQTHLKQNLKGMTLAVAKDVASVSKLAVKRPFDGVIVETKRGQLPELSALQRAVDPAHTFIVAGSRALLRQTPGLVQTLTNGHGRRTNEAGSGMCLESYIESKLGDFVRDMKKGSAKNLHPMLIQAVERPLISLVLKETNGNQIQAAHVLGLNRNTLRKKITELRIPVKRNGNGKTNSA